MKKYNSTRTNIAVNNDLHKQLVSHVQNNDGKIYKFVEKAIKEKLEREKPMQSS